jgi:hypothetical protein
MPSRASEQQQQRGAATSTTTTTTMTFNDLNSLHPEHRIIANAKNHSPLPSSLRGQGEFDKDKSLRMTTATTTTQSQHNNAPRGEFFSVILLHILPLLAGLFLQSQFLSEKSTLSWMMPMLIGHDPETRRSCHCFSSLSTPHQIHTRFESSLCLICFR